MQNQRTTIAPAAPPIPMPLAIAAGALLLIALVVAVPGDPEWWKVVVLGVVQGVTEWLPISSTGHLLIVSNLLRYEGSIGGTFEIFIQLGTVLSVVAFYFRDLLGQAQALLGRGTAEATRDARRLWIAVAVAFLPAAVVGLLARDFIKTVLFESPTVIAGALIVGGVVFLLIERLPQRSTATAELGRITPLQALGVGVAQIFALIPGMSRSGSTIVGGLLSGIRAKICATPRPSRSTSPSPSSAWPRWWT
jgi:undecaprenyl-diphosphatase